MYRKYHGGVAYGHIHEPSTRGSKHHGGRGPWFFLIGTSVTLVVMVLAIGPLAAWKTRQGLAGLKGHAASFSALKFRPFSLAYELDDFSLVKVSTEGAHEPFFQARQIHVNVLAASLWRGKPAAHLLVVEPKLSVSAGPQSPSDDEIDWVDAARGLLPFEVSGVEVQSGEFQFIDRTEPDFPPIRLHHLDATVENFVVGASLVPGWPTTVAVLATVQEDARFTALINAAPAEGGVNFAGSAQLKRLDLKEFSPVISSKKGTRVTEGRLDAFAEFKCKSGQLLGEAEALMIKPKVVAGRVRSDVLSSVLADRSLGLVAEHNADPAAARAIPITATLARPKEQLWPTVLGVVRNALLLAMRDAFEGLPAPADENDLLQPLTQPKPGDVERVRPSVKGRPKS